jgi:spore cortex formation protein SpoVR/YcgB (stage V sporulation)
LDTNSEVTNLLVAAHVYAHVDFFKNNIYFADTNRNMVNEAVEHAIRIDEYIERYGLEPVERIMDIGFAVDRHIDYHKGLNRKPYPQRRVVEKVRKVKEYDDVFGDEEFVVSREVLGDKMPPHPEKDVLWFLANYAPIEPWERDVLEIIRKESFYFYPQFETKVINEGWACVTGETRVVTDHGLIPIRELVETRAHVRVFDGKAYRQVTDWYTPGKRKVYRIRTRRGYELCGSDTHRILLHTDAGKQWRAACEIRPGDHPVLAIDPMDKDRVIEVVDGEEEVFDLTVDETHRYVAGGFINHNSYWHAEIINNYTFTPEEMFEFGVLHSDVVNPGSRMGVNPYYLGYKILVDVEKRWDELYKEGKSKINGKQKLLEIRMLENDVSFLRNYLTQELAEKLELFTYGYACDHYPHSKRLCPKCGEIAIKSRKFEDVIETLIASKFNYGMPRILVREVGNDGTLYLEQDRADHRGLDMKFAQKTIDYVYQLWKRPVHLVGRNEQMKEVTIRSS